MFNVKRVQEILIAKGYLDNDPGADGDFGQESEHALMLALEAVAARERAVVKATNFDAASAARLAKAHPDIQRLMNEARKRIAFKVLDSQRGKDAQELAFRRGHSKVHFKDSAHNYAPAIAVDIVPDPLDWNDKKSFLAVQEVVGWYDPVTKKGKGLALTLRIPIRWGGDWNMDGSTSDGWDLPHYELHPWRKFAAQSKLFNG